METEVFATCRVTLPRASRSCYVLFASHAVFDRAVKAHHKQIVVAVADGEMTVKRLFSRAGRVELRPENPANTPITIGEGREFALWGVVIGSVRQFKA